LAKPAIFIPMPNSHQEDNANYIKKYEAGLILKQNRVTPKEFSKKILDLLENNELKEKYRNNLYKLIAKDASEKIINIIDNYVK
jgi:UDP-N-acetylglucosamine:LPS N-acetylglucosamine transferase